MPCGACLQAREMMKSCLGVRTGVISQLCVDSQGNHIFTSGATGTNAAVIRGALRAEKPELLTVVLPQSLHKQPPESQELLQEVGRRGRTPYARTV